jgi:acyl-CoA reductase-like NAD-dependent aldehyde dehydrogenase
MDLYTACQIEQHTRDAGNLPASDYLAQLSRIEEKFRIWKNKGLLERAAIFKKLAALSRKHGDSLSEWVVSEMGILLENSEVD